MEVKSVQDIFKDQLSRVSPITEDIYDKITFKRTSLGSLMEIGDKIIYAYVVSDINNLDERKLVQLCERELEYFKGAQYVGINEVDSIPIFKK